MCPALVVALQTSQLSTQLICCTRLQATRRGGACAASCWRPLAWVSGGVMRVMEASMVYFVLSLP